MTNLKPLTITTIVTNLLIVIGAGHGTGVLGLVIIFGLPDIVSNGFTYGFNASYEDRMSACTVISLLGHVLIVTSMFIKTVTIKFWIKVLGLIGLWWGFVLLTNNYRFSSADEIGIVTGIPFIIFSVFL